MWELICSHARIIKAVPRRSRLFLSGSFFHVEHKWKHLKSKESDSICIYLLIRAIASWNNSKMTQIVERSTSHADFIKAPLILHCLSRRLSLICFPRSNLQENEENFAENMMEKRYAHEATHGRILHIGGLNRMFSSRFVKLEWSAGLPDLTVSNCLLCVFNIVGL